MTIPIKRRVWLHAALAASATISVPRARACEYFSPTLRVTHPWTRATPADAAFAVLGMRFNDVAEDEQLLDVQTPVAEAVMYVPGGDAGGHAGGHSAAHARGLTGLDLAAGSAVSLPLDIPSGRETVLGSADLGALGPHLRLLRLTQALEIGRSYPLRLVFKKGGTVKAQMNVDYARFT